MFREMRRKKQQLTQEESINILENGNHGILALAGDNGYPYAVPLSYLYINHKIYIHAARSGHKIDAAKANDKASFCVVAQDKVVPDEYTTYFKSVIAFGRIRIMKDAAEIEKALWALGKKYNPEDSDEHRKAVIDRAQKTVCMLELSIEHLSGKEAKELVAAK